MAGEPHNQKEWGLEVYKGKEGSQGDELLRKMVTGDRLSGTQAVS